jgi:hypothetical protein
MTSIARACESAVSCLTLMVCLSSTLAAAPQEPPPDLPVSLDRIRKELTKNPPNRLNLDMRLQIPVATFRTRVEQRVRSLTFEEWLEKEFTLTEIQRQSADWAARCCGMSLEPLFTAFENALERRKIRKIREQIARELAELEAARKKATPGTNPAKCEHTSGSTPCR